MAEDTFIDRLRNDLNAEVQMLMDVATWDASIPTVNDEYKVRRKAIRSRIQRLALSDPNEWPDLWLWYGRWKEDESLGSYQQRREFLIHTYQPIFDALDNLSERQLGTGIDVPLTGWTDVDRQVAQLRESYARAQTPEAYRQVGLLCRDIFISLGHAIFDADKHWLSGEPPPKHDDAKQRLDMAVRAEFPGEAKQKLRTLVRATWDFVQPVVHDQTDNQMKAMIAADATIHLLKILTAMFPNPTGRVADWDEADEQEEEYAGPSEEDRRYYLQVLGEGEWDE